MASLLLQPANQTEEILSKCLTFQTWIGVEGDPDPIASALKHIYLMVDNDFDKKIIRYASIFPLPGGLNGTRKATGNLDLLGAFEFTIGTRVRLMQLDAKQQNKEEIRAFIGVVESIVTEFVEYAAIYSDKDINDVSIDDPGPSMRVHVEDDYHGLQMWFQETGE